MMKINDLNLINLNFSRKDKKIKILIAESQDFEVAVYILVNGVRVHTVWYSIRQDYTFELDSFEFDDIVQAVVFFRYDSSDTNCKSIKSRIIRADEYKELEIVDERLAELYLHLENDLGSNESNNFFQCLLSDKTSVKELVYKRLIKEVRMSNLVNINLFESILIDCFLTLSYSKSNWQYSSSTLGTPDIKLFMTFQKHVESAFKEGKVREYCKKIIIGAIATLKEDWVLAEKCFRTAKYPKGLYMSHFFSGSNSFRNPIAELSNLQKKVDYSNLLTITMNDVENIKRNYNRSVFVFSAESNYFSKFAMQAISSVVDANLDVDFLFLVIGDYQSISETITIVRNYCSENNRECHFILGNAKCELKALSASARFIAAYEMSKRTLSNIFVFDIDMFFTTDMADDLIGLQATNTISCSLKVCGPRVFPWTNIAAAGTYLPSSEHSFYFLKAIVEYLTRNFSDEYENWWIDQNALFSAYKQLRYLYPESAVSNMHATTGKGLTKNDDESLIQWKRCLRRV